jgi:hypothetical protein
MFGMLRIFTGVHGMIIMVTCAVRYLLRGVGGGRCYSEVTAEEHPGYEYT